MIESWNGEAAVCCLPLRRISEKLAGSGTEGDGPWQMYEPSIHPTRFLSQYVQDQIIKIPSVMSTVATFLRQ